MNTDQILQSPEKVEAQALNDLKKPVSQKVSGIQPYPIGAEFIRIAGADCGAVAEITQGQALTGFETNNFIYESE